MRQEYDRCFLQEVAACYPGTGDISEHRLFTSGYENSNYFIKTDTGAYVVKIFEGLDMTRESIEFEVEIMDASNQAGVKSPKIFRNKDNSLTTILGGKHVILMEYIEGENMDKKEASDDLIREMGQEAGKMDVALKKYRDGSKTRQNYEFDLKNFLILEDKTKHLPSDFERGIFDSLFQKFREIKPKFEELPTGIIHNDIVLHNVLAKEGKLQAILDFSDMAFSPYVQNIAVSFSQAIFTYNWQPQQVGIFLESYEEQNPLSENEKSFLFDLTAVRFGILSIELNYWNVRFGEDSQRTTYVRDNYGFLKKFLDMGKQEFESYINI